jgi:multiple sugar transport system ATP-binding protein
LLDALGHGNAQVGDGGAGVLGSRVAVLKDGELMQVDTPQMLFDAPDNLFVATFIGSPAMNLAEARLVRDQGPMLVFADHKVPLPEQLVSSREGLDRYFDRPLIVGMRPSSMEDGAFAPQDWPRVKGEVAVTEELGSEVNLIFHMAAPPVHHDIMIARFDKAAKDEVEAEELAGEGHGLWTARVNPKTSAKVGRTVDLAVDTSGFHFFDKDSGLAIGRIAEGVGARERREAKSDQA